MHVHVLPPEWKIIIELFLFLSLTDLNVWPVFGVGSIWLWTARQSKRKCRHRTVRTNIKIFQIEKEVKWMREEDERSVEDSLDRRRGPELPARLRLLVQQPVQVIAHFPPLPGLRPLVGSNHVAEHTKESDFWKPQWIQPIKITFHFQCCGSGSGLLVGSVIINFGSGSYELQFLVTKIA